ncbi:MAG: oligosaccharide flippase family protein [Prevotella sp.]|nr:oligosaccharide flippase family protein [Prevotella sp.]
MSDQASSNNKRIAKNTLLLYFRMLLTMAVSLYTSRVVLGALGVEDYGIYNVVGGVVAMFSMLSGSLSAAISRFITFELGKGDKEKLIRVFSSSVTIQIGLCVIVLIFAETIGLWFLNSKMVIPENRMYAANWVYQLSLLTFVINLISIPYNAAIIAHERMSAFAYISIFEAVGKLTVAYCIVRFPIDRLILYAIMLAAISIIIRIIYGIYCKKRFEECTYHFIYDHELLKQMFGFAGWNFIGASSALLRDQGGNIVINLFCGPVVNAARGIASQVNTAISSFVANFMTALNPQITKSYAAGDHKYMITLLFQGARLSFYILLLLSLPVLVNTHYILQLWLGQVPEHTVLFVQFVLILGMCESISYPLITAMLATGRIRNYQLVVGGLQMMNLPVSYFFLRFGAIPETVLIVAIVISQFCFAARLYMLRGMIGLKTLDFLKNVYSNVIIVSLLSAIIPIIIAEYINEDFLNFILLSIISIFITIVVEFYIGCSSNERKFVIAKIKQIIHKKI